MKQLVVPHKEKFDFIDKKNYTFNSLKETVLCFPNPIQRPMFSSSKMCFRKLS